MKKLLRICTILLMSGIISVIAPQLTSQAATDGMTYADDAKTIVTKVIDAVHVEIPDGVIYITVDAFKDCKNIEELSLPTSFEGLVYYDVSTKRCDVADINEWNDLFARCKNFRTYLVATGNPNYRAYKGVLYSPKKILCSVPVGYTGEIVMSDDANQIYSGALSSCDRVTSILLSRNFVSVTTDWFDGTVFCMRNNIESREKSAASGKPLRPLRILLKLSGN